MSTQKINTILVKDVMLQLESCPVIGKKVIFKEALEEMGRTRLGIVCITDKDNKLLGILTDGDIRRGLIRGMQLNDPVEDAIHTNPIVGYESDSNAVLL